MATRLLRSAGFVLNVAIAVAPAAHAAIPMLSAGYSHSLALRSDGTVLAWGQDSYGQLGLGRSLVATTPTRIGGVPGIAQVSTGCDHTLALGTDGTVWSWGSNVFGQLGDGTNDDRPVPGPVPGLSGVKMVGAGCQFSIAMLRDGTLVSWGNNIQGALGTGGTSSRSTPGPVARGNAYRSVSTGRSFVVAIDDGGLLWAWGSQCYGNPICSTSTPILLPTPSYQGVASLAIGGQFAVALMTDGSVRAWGNTAYGILGWDPRAGRPPGSPPGPPYPIAGLANIVAVAAGGDHALALRSDGTVWAWGRNETGQLGDGAPTLLRATAQPVPGLAGVSAIAAGSMHSVARTSDGRVWTWGNNVSGELGDGTQVQRNSPLAVPGLSGMAAVTASKTQAAFNVIPVQTFAIGTDGSLWGWGSTALGQLGTAQDLNRAVPARIPGLAGIAMVSAGYAHSAALGGDGSVWTWGENASGALGDGTNLDRSTPAKVPGFSNAIAVTASNHFTFAIKSDGTLWYWGRGDLRPSGRGADVFTPTQVNGVTGAVAVSINGLVLRNDGGLTVVTLGGTTAPYFVLGNSTFVAVSASNALRSDGTLWTLTNAGLVQVPDITDAVSVSTYGTQWVVRRDGTVLGRGSNNWGQLGDGTIAGRSAFTAVPGLSGIEAIAAGGQHVLALTRDNRVLSWGYNRYGMLGDGTLAARRRPVAVLAEDGAGTVAGGDWFLVLDASRPTIPPDLVPPLLAVISGDLSSTLTARVRFRAADVGQPIRVFAFAPASLAKHSIAKDDACVLAQLGPTGLQSVSAANLSAVGTVQTAAGQSLAVLNAVSASQVAGATFCVGTGSTGTATVDPANHVCVATVPGATPCFGVSAATTTANVPGVLSGLWWNAAESGWGVHFTQRRDIVFAAWYAYDGTGAPKWYVASDCRMSGGATGTAGTCSGTLYEVKGAAFFGANFNPSAVSATTAGTLQVSFADAGSASMSYAVGTQSRTVAITRQPIAAGTVPGVDYTDLWWNASESGWGLAIAQQASTLFLAWYVYDGTGKPVWYVASSCVLLGTGCTGTLYRTTGPPLGPSFNPAQVQVISAGTITVSFTDGNNGVISYTVNGVSGSKAITRQTF